MGIRSRFVEAVFGLMLLGLVAGDAFPVAPGMLPDMPPEVVSWREAILSQEEYLDLVEQWRKYVDEHR